MIVVTGAAGFIASGLVSKLNNFGFTDLVLVDDFSKVEKHENLVGKKFAEQVDRAVFDKWFQLNQKTIDFVFHLGARTDTTEFDINIFDNLNLNYSIRVWELCTEFDIPLVYASSGATYGLGEHGYSDDHSVTENLKPLNPYGDSKNDFDKWVLRQEFTPPNWYGIKFFNVYGPNEYHKGRMASVIFHTYKQVKETGGMKLFRSHNENYKDGEQLRDFVYVKDVVDVLCFLMEKKPKDGIYNLGTGTARTFLDLAKATFKAMSLEPNISFVDTPEDIRDKYQYFTQAEMAKLIGQGYDKPFTSLENGVEDYVKNYLILNSYL